MSAPSGDRRYYARLFDFAAVYKLSHAPRRAMFDFFMRELRPTERDKILDLGATSLPDPQENMFELHYPHPGRITAAGIEDCSFLEKSYPGLKFVRVAAGRPLPFSDGEFDVGFSNAAIEHVGSREAQRFFLSELIRVSRRCFVTTPNRWFPVELHTRLPFIHWLPRPLFSRILSLLGFEFYSKEENLNLLTCAELSALVPTARAKRARIVKQFFLGFPSNLMLIIET
jgi:hypothetical protein